MFTTTLANLFRCYSLLQGIIGRVLSIPVSRIVPYFPILMSQRRERYISSKSFPSSRASPVGRYCVGHFLAVLSRWELLILELAGKQR